MGRKPSRDQAKSPRALWGQMSTGTTTAAGERGPDTCGSQAAWGTVFLGPQDPAGPVSVLPPGDPCHSRVPVSSVHPSAPRCHEVGIGEGPRALGSYGTAISPAGSWEQDSQFAQGHSGMCSLGSSVSPGRASPLPPPAHGGRSARQPEGIRQSHTAVSHICSLRGSEESSLPSDLSRLASSLRKEEEEMLKMELLAPLPGWTLEAWALDSQVQRGVQRKG